MERGNARIGAREVLREVKEKSGMTQKELAEGLGVSQSTVSVGFAREHIGVDLFVKYLDAMGFSVAVGKKTRTGKFVAVWELEA